MEPRCTASQQRDSAEHDKEGPGRLQLCWSFREVSLEAASPLALGPTAVAAAAPAQHGHPLQALENWPPCPEGGQEGGWRGAERTGVGIEPRV